MSDCENVENGFPVCLLVTELEAENQRLEAIADPLTKALYREMSERHTKVCEENKRLKGIEVLSQKVVDSVNVWGTTGEMYTVDVAEFEALAAALEEVE
jgi:dihydrodipicolinate synthase/N-acetylneuraminate lyase